MTKLLHDLQAIENHDGSISMMLESMMLDTEKCKRCKFGFDATEDNDDEYIQGCNKHYLPAMGYPCRPEEKQYEEGDGDQ